MASHDVLDVLNLPADSPGAAAPRPSKKQKTTASRSHLKGLAREVQNLGGDNPIAIVPEISTFKKRRFLSRKPAARWNLTPFRNSARDDNSLHLRHWRKQIEDTSKRTLPPQNPEQQPSQEPNLDTQQQPPQYQKPDQAPTQDRTQDPGQQAPELEDSAFARFHATVDVPEYSEDQYNANLTSPDWSKEETDYLFDLARSYDLRWPVIWDRYDYSDPNPDPDPDPATAVISASQSRTLEDLKARYYDVAAKMMALTKPVQYMTQAEFALHEMMANFNPSTEKARKKFASDSLSRSKEEAREEEALLVEVRRILARTEKFNQERRELYDRLDYPHTDQDTSSYKSSAGLQTLLTNLVNVDKNKKRKSLQEAAAASTPSATQPASAQPTSTPASESRRESVAAGNNRDSAADKSEKADKPEKPEKADKAEKEKPEKPEKPSKKGATQPERKKLTEQEEQTYGVSHHDRLGSGPTFRYEKINKILTTKSNAQHQRITNTLTELDIPSRLNMPTSTVVGGMERLLSSIGTLLDLRKMHDKIDAELKLEQAKKTEREKALGINTEAEKTGDNKTEPNEGNGTATVNGTAEPVAVTAAAAAESSAGAEEKTNGESTGSNASSEANRDKGASAVATPAAEIKQETTDDKAPRPQSSSGHKRSASELGTDGDDAGSMNGGGSDEKNPKRQKK